MNNQSHFNGVFFMIGAPQIFIVFLSVLISSSTHRYTDPTEAQLEEQLQTHVYALAADSMWGRGILTDGISKAASYITAQIDIMGLGPLGPWGRADRFVGPEAKELENILASTSSSPAPEGWILITAHYDHLGVAEEDSVTEIFNGAHDNASGVAVALEAGRILAQECSEPAGIGLVFFSGEEDGLLGSRHLVEVLGDDLRLIRAVINIDAVGHLAADPLLLVGILGQSILDSVIVAAAEEQGIRISRATLNYSSGDQAPFLQAGIPAVQLTTGPHELMNTVHDDPQTLDYEGMAALCRLVTRIAGDLASMETPLDPPPPPLTHTSSGEKRIRFGIIPDFTFAGTGVRAQGVMPDSPAEDVGLQAGDVLYGMGMREIIDLGDLASVLRDHADGDTVTVFYRRDGLSLKADAVLQGR